jgi:hypothetical protein
MKPKTKYRILIVSAGFILLAVSLKAAEIEGEIQVQGKNHSLQTAFNISVGERNSANGFFRYSDSKGKTHIKIGHGKIDGEYAWFAGECTESPEDKNGRWFFGAVRDGGEPGHLVDLIWWEWLAKSKDAESIAKSKVRNMEIPSQRQKIQSGNIKVSD